ncbi:MAG: transposase [Nitrosomonas sp.]|nr:transposase [Nitrosomonas sp.]
MMLCKMPLVGIWNDDLSDEWMEEMANLNLHVMRFLGLSLEDDGRDSFCATAILNAADSNRT